MKKEKYQLFVEYIDTIMVKDILLTKAQYNSQLKYFGTLIDETRNAEYPVEHREETYEAQFYYVIAHYFTSGCCTIILSKYIAKQGYIFK